MARKKENMDEPRILNLEGIHLKPKYSHPSAKRCDNCAFTHMRADGTKDGGKIKRWKCPKCEATAKTIGKPI